ncbi:unnamed protein product [Brassica rapa subsp. trilocularis]
MGDYTCEITTSNHHHFKTSMQAVEFHHRNTCFSHHQNSHSSWSLMCRNQTEEVVARYGCKVWGLQRSLGSYVSSFIAARLEAKKKYRVLAYTDIGLILLYEPWFHAVLSFVESDALFRQAGLVTRTKDGIVLGFKVVLVRTRVTNNECFVAFNIYSSETGLWSKILHSPLPLISLNLLEPVTLSWNLHWFGLNLDGQVVVVSYDFYGSLI